jgi:hypothetical protein
LQAVSLAVPVTEVPRGTATFKSMFISAVFLQRLGVWIGGYPFPVCLAVLPLGLGWLLFQQIARISISRLVLYTPLPVTVIISLALGVDRISGKSATLYLLM